MEPSPMWVGIIAILSLFVALPGFGFLVVYFHDRSRHIERMHMIEKGFPMPPPDPARGMRWVRLAGIVFAALGLGSIVESILTRGTVDIPGYGDFRYARPGSVGIIPLLIGAGLLLDAWFRMRELREQDKSARDIPALPSAAVRSE